MTTIWPGYDQPTLASADLPADRWPAGRTEPAAPVQLGADVSTAAELLRAGGCSPQCLVSERVPVQGCDCACGGAYHGALSDTDMASAVRRRDHRLAVTTTRKERPDAPR